MGSFVLQFYQDTTNNCIFKKILKDIVLFLPAKKYSKYELLLQKSKQIKHWWHDWHQKTQKICEMGRLQPGKTVTTNSIDIVGKGKKLPNRNSNNIVTNNLQNNKPKVIVNHCQVRTCPYFGQYHQPNSMRQTTV